MARLEHIPRYPGLWFTLPGRIRDLRERGAVRDWVEFAFGSPFPPGQVRSEISEFIEQVAARRPRAVLEIGTAEGGTLLLLTLAAAPDATVISVDLPRGPFGGGYPLWKTPYYRRFALPSQQMHLLRADSHAPRTLQRVRAILDRPLDVLFIDADHTYRGVKADWEMYGPLVSPDGLVGFHDIVAHPQEPECEVDAFWQETKATFAHQEIVADRAQTWGGIGVIAPGGVIGG